MGDKWRIDAMYHFIKNQEKLTVGILDWSIGFFRGFSECGTKMQQQTEE